MARWGEAKEVLNRLANQRRALEIIRQTGEYQYAYTVLGVSKSSWNRYFRENPSFEQDCKDAKQYYKVDKQLNRFVYGMRIDAAKELAQRVKSGRARDTTLVALVLGRKKRKD